MPVVDISPISVQRARLGLSTPTPEEKLEVWKNVTVVQTDTRKETGGYSPFPVTRQAHFHPARTKLVTGGVRGSKSFSLSMEALTWLLHSDLIWLVGKTYEDAKQEFEYVTEAAYSLNWVNRVTWATNRYNPCVLETKWGTILETKAGADPQSLMSRAPDMIGLCEPGLLDLSVYRHAVERLSTRRGLLYMAGTFENNAAWMEQFWKQWKRWPNAQNAKSFSSPTHTNRVSFPLGVYDPEYQRMKFEALTAQDPGQESAGWDEYLRRLVGVPASSPEIIFSKLFKPRDHVTNVEWIRERSKGVAEPVYLAIDPGYSGNSRYVVLAIQVVGKQIRVLDEVTAQYTTHEQMRLLCAQREWWPFAHAGTIDPYAGESHVYGAVSPAEEWRKQSMPGPVNLVTPQRLKNTEEEIRVAADYFTGIKGYTLVISQRCERLRWELATWKRKKKDNVLGEPEKKGNDAIKALMYFLIHHNNGQIAQMARQPERISSYNLVGSGMDPILAMEEELRMEREQENVWGEREMGWLGG